MREVAEEMNVPFLDMTAKSCDMYENSRQKYCMEHYFNCGDKTHTGQEGGMVNAHMAYLLIKNCPELAELHHLVALPEIPVYAAYCQAIEERGKQEAFAAKGTPFNQKLYVTEVRNMKNTRDGYVPTSGLWPAGEIDEVANRYIDYTIKADKKKGLVIETITVPVFAKGGNGMNIHINYGFGDDFKGVTTIYENTALPKGEPLVIKLKNPILVPAGEILHLRILPWYDSKGKPQKGKRLQIGEVKVTGKKLK